MFYMKRCLPSSGVLKRLNVYEKMVLPPPRLQIPFTKNLCQAQTSLEPESMEEKIIKSVRSAHGILYDHNLNRFVATCKELQRVYNVLDEDVFVRYVLKQPLITNYNFQQFKNCTRILFEHGLEFINIFKLYSKCPQVLERSENELESILKTLRECGLSGKHLRNVISGAPALMVTSPRFVQYQFKHLEKLFPNCDVRKLVWLSPNILFDDIEITEEKLMFMVHQMNVKHELVASSLVLSLTLPQIQKRLEFLLRTGHYRKVHPKLTVNNPSLEKMMDTPLRELVQKYAGVSYEEYTCFEKLYDKILEEKDEAKSDEDSDSEED